MAPRHGDVGAGPGAERKVTPWNACLHHASRGTIGAWADRDKLSLLHGLKTCDRSGRNAQPMVREELLAAFENKPEGGKILTWQELTRNPRLSDYAHDLINAEVEKLENEGALRTHHETGSLTPFSFDSISLPPE